MIKVTLFVLLITAFLAPIFSFANGGDQRVVENKYLINLSRAPFTPRAGDEIALLASFVDLETNKLVAEDLTVKIRISTLGGGGSAKRTFVFEKDKVLVKGGVLEFSHTFNDPGLHEIFFDFALALNPQKIYEAPDFLLDVQKPLNVYSTNQILIAVFGIFVTGLVAGWFTKSILHNRYRQSRKDQPHV